METRVIRHDEKHYDIEALFPVMEKGVWLDVWAVIYCNENQKMVQAQQAERPANNACGCIQNLSPVMETAKTKHLEEVMDDTTATHHKELLEEKKDEIDAQIASMRKVRDDAEDDGNYTLVALMDKGIDDLLTEKDNITATFSDVWSDERIDTGLIELNAPYRPATNGDDLPF